MAHPTRSVCLAALFLTAMAAAAATADEPIRLEETFQEGRVYRLSTRVDLSGTLTPPAEKGQPAPKPLTVKGDSAIDYDERLLAVDKGEVRKTIRLYSRMDFERTLGDRPQARWPTAVRRLVACGRSQASRSRWTAWVDLGRDRPGGNVDIFTPALVGMLPDHAVRIGDAWTVTADAVRELTDMERIDDGKIECRLDDLSTRDGRRQARVTFAGAVRGANEDGPNRQQLDGWYLFDLGSHHLELPLPQGRAFAAGRGRQGSRPRGGALRLESAGGRGRPRAGRRGVEGRGAGAERREHAPAVRQPDFGVRFVRTPRRWHPAAQRGGSQPALDGADGSGLLLTLDTQGRGRRFSGEQFLKEESRDWLEGGR